MRVYEDVTWRARWGGGSGHVGKINVVGTTDGYII